MRLYQLLLLLCPSSFRKEYGGEMAAVFERRLMQSSLPGKLWIWLEATCDLVLTAIAAHWDLLRQDIRYAARTTAKSPGFALVAVTVAALGVAAPTAVFSLADHVLLRALPFPEPDRLVKLWEDESAKGYSRNDVSPGSYRDWKNSSTSFVSMASFRGLSVNLSGIGEPLRVEGTAANPELFSILGAVPLFGRTPTLEEDRPEAEGTVVLSYRLWQRLFGQDRNVLGRRLMFDEEAYTVIGVMPADFRYPQRETELWTTLRMGEDWFADRRNNMLQVLARLKPGVTIEQALAEMRVVGSALAKRYPAELGETSVTVIRMRDELSTRSRSILTILIVASLFVLLIAAGNLANLFLVRASARRAEIAVRTALGAGRYRLIRQLLTEGLLLAGIGGAAGTALATWSMPLLSRLVPTVLPIAQTPEIDWRVLWFALVVTLLTGVAFGVLPALRSTGGSLGLRAATGTHRDFVRRTLVVTQVAASVALLMATGLLIRALDRIESTNPGFNPAGRFAFRTSLPMPKYQETAKRERFYAQVLDEIRALPQVQSAAAISFRPMGDVRGGIWPVAVPGKAKGEQHVSSRFVTPGYFSTMQVPLLRGRDFTAADNAGSQPVAVVSQSFIDEIWPGEDGLGRIFEMPFIKRRTAIIGIVSDVRFRGLEARSEPQMYFASAQALSGSFTWFAPKDFIVRATADASALMPAIRQVVSRADPLQPVSDVRSLTGLIEDDTVSRRVQLWVVAAFAGAAFLLAAIGIHGLLAFAVAQRTQEIGLRRALGASGTDIASMVFGEGLVLSLTGALIGIAAAYALGKTLESFFAGVPPSDAATLLAALGLSVVMTLGGTLAPAIRALRVDPAMALRGE